MTMMKKAFFVVGHEGSDDGFQDKSMDMSPNGSCRGTDVQYDRRASRQTVIQRF